LVTLFEQDIRTNDRQSSKGNQLKWLNGGIWYKADYTGYEGLTEYVISALLKETNLKSEDFAVYDTVQISYKNREYLGCFSEDFLPDGWQMITLERLFQQCFGKSLYKSIFGIEDHEKRLVYLVEQTKRMTGLEDFGAYMSKLLTVDAFFLNEDRHTHNIAVLLDEKGNYHYCPIFDNGAGLLADTKMDYPLSESTERLIETVRAKTFCRDFDEQLDIAEKLYGQHLRFHFDYKKIDQIIEAEPFYTEQEKQRVKEILHAQRRKYEYL